jgi:hypothetical protein
MTRVNGFYIQIEDSSGNPYGDGPISEASYWEYTARLDQAGAFSFALPATVAKAAIVQNERIARAYVILGGLWVNVGAGPITEVTRTKGADGRVLLTAKGDDLLRELTYPSVHNLTLDDIPVMSFPGAMSTLFGYFPAGWNYTIPTTSTINAVYARFNGESLLAAIIKVAQSQEMHFYRDTTGTGRNIVIANAFTASGIRAIQAGPGPLATETCAITSLTQHLLSSDFYTAIYPHGSGNGDIDLRLKATNRAAPSGYTLDAANNKLSYNSNVSIYGLRERHVDFKEIGPVSNTAADLQAAANALFDAALRELRLISAGIGAATYDVSLAGCNALLRPMQTIQLAYRSVEEGLSIDGTALNILEATWRVEASEIQTTKVVVSTSDRLPQTDTGTIADSIATGSVYRAMPQIGPNSYWENGVVYVGDDQTNNIGEMPFIFGPEVMQIQQVVLRYRVTDTISPTKTTAGNVTSTAQLGQTQHAHALLWNTTGASPGFPVRYDPALGGTLYVVTGTTGTNQGGATSLIDIDHLHSINLATGLTTTFGLFKSTATYALGDLEISLNGGSTWVNLNTGVSKGGSYYELNLTLAPFAGVVQDATTFRPVQENNLIQIRRTTAAGVGKTATVYLKLGVRNSVQSILYQ